MILSAGCPASAFWTLDVEPQHVVLGQTQSADGGAGFEATMRAVPVIAMQPDWEFGGTLIGIQIRAGIRPLLRLFARSARLFRLS